MTRKNNKDHIVQISIFIIEIITVLSILTKISLILFPLKNIFCWELIERIIGLYTFYQIFIFATLTQIDDSEKDSYNTLKNIYELSLLYFDIEDKDTEEKENYKNMLFYMIDKQCDSTAMNAEDIKEKYTSLKAYIDKNDRFKIEFELKMINHWLTHLDLQFTKSILLRQFKNPSFNTLWVLIILILCILLSVSLWIYK